MGDTDRHVTPFRRLGARCVFKALVQTTSKAYKTGVEYAFDLEKDQRNRAKHGVSLALAEANSREVRRYADDLE